jgi:restriction system protein
MSSHFQFEEGRDGERYTRLNCRLYLGSKKYRQYHDIFIPASPRPTQIDHIIISEHGIFVIETKTTNGQIYGHNAEPKWTKVFRKKKYIIQNPLHQNYFHTQILAKFLNIEDSKLFSVIVFWGDCQLQTDLPENVCKETAFIDYIRSKKQIMLTAEEMSRVCRILHDLKDRKLDKEREEHVKSLKSTKICPRCGGKLIQLTVKRGGKIGTKFIGCSNFPRCSYSRNLESDQKPVVT